MGSPTVSRQTVSNGVKLEGTQQCPSPRHPHVWGAHVSEGASAWVVKGPHRVRENGLFLLEALMR